jgi:hypothetical protein
MTARAGRQPHRPRGAVSRKRWTRRQIEALGTITDIGTAGSIFRMSETSARQLHKAGQFPVPVIKVGRKLIVPTAPILALLGIDGGDDIRSQAADMRGSGAGAQAGTAAGGADQAPPAIRAV